MIVERTEIYKHPCALLDTEFIVVYRAIMSGNSMNSFLTQAEGNQALGVKIPKTLTTPVPAQIANGQANDPLVADPVLMPNTVVLRPTAVGGSASH